MSASLFVNASFGQAPSCQQIQRLIPITRTEYTGNGSNVTAAGGKRWIWENTRHGRAKLSERKASEKVGGEARFLGSRLATVNATAWSEFACKTSRCVAAGSPEDPVHPTWGIVEGWLSLTGSYPSRGGSGLHLDMSRKTLPESWISNQAPRYLMYMLRGHREPLTWLLTRNIPASLSELIYFDREQSRLLQQHGFNQRHQREVFGLFGKEIAKAALHQQSVRCCKERQDSLRLQSQRWIFGRRRCSNSWTGRRRRRC